MKYWKYKGTNVMLDYVYFVIIISLPLDASFYISSAFGDGDKIPVKFTNIDCTGSDSTLSSCRKDDQIDTNCNFGHTVGVRCFSKCIHYITPATVILLLLLLDSVLFLFSLFIFSPSFISHFSKVLMVVLMVMCVYGEGSQSVREKFRCAKMESGVISVLIHGMM